MSFLSDMGWSVFSDFIVMAWKRSSGQTYSKTFRQRQWKIMTKVHLWHVFCSSGCKVNVYFNILCTASRIYLWTCYYDFCMRPVLNFSYSIKYWVTFYILLNHKSACCVMLHSTIDFDTCKRSVSRWL